MKEYKDIQKVNKPTKKITSKGRESNQVQYYLENNYKKASMPKPKAKHETLLNIKPHRVPIPNSEYYIVLLPPNIPQNSTLYQTIKPAFLSERGGRILDCHTNIMLANYSNIQLLQKKKKNST